MTMELEQIKAEILKIYSHWKNTPDSITGNKDAELEESFVRDLIIKYCENKGYEVDGYPFQKQILGKTDNDNDEDYFCYERNLKYLDVLATIHEDVMEILYFYGKTFWPDQMESKEDYKKQLLLDILYNRYEIEF
jgi:hypothetical protein